MEAQLALLVTGKNSLKSQLGDHRSRATQAGDQRGLIIENVVAGGHDVGGEEILSTFIVRPMGGLST